MNENNTQPSSAEQPAQPTPLDVSVRITPLNKDGNLLAYANVTLGGCFAVTGIRVMDSEKGVFVAMPTGRTARASTTMCVPHHAGDAEGAAHRCPGRVSEGDGAVGFPWRTDAGLCAGRDPERQKTAAERPTPERANAPQQRKADKGAR